MTRADCRRRPPAPLGTGLDPRQVRGDLTRYTTPRTGRSLLELAASVIPFVGLWVLAWLALTYVGYWLALVLAVPAAGFLVRLFLIQHDCGHGSVFPRRTVNDWLGRALGVLTLTPYDHWRHTHALHHAGSGNLDRRGIGDVETLTVREYRSLGVWPVEGLLQYRIRSEVEPYERVATEDRLELVPEPTGRGSGNLAERVFSGR